jgi:hypothetical protein
MLVSSCCFARYAPHRRRPTRRRVVRTSADRLYSIASVSRLVSVSVCTYVEPSRLGCTRVRGCFVTAESRPVTAPNQDAHAACQDELSTCLEARVEHAGTPTVLRCRIHVLGLILRLIPCKRIVRGFYNKTVCCTTTRVSPRCANPLQDGISTFQTKVHRRRARGGLGLDRRDPAAPRVDYGLLPPRQATQGGAGSAAFALRHGLRARGKAPSPLRR